MNDTIPMEPSLCQRLVYLREAELNTLGHQREEFCRCGVGGWGGGVKPGAAGRAVITPVF